MSEPIALLLLGGLWSGWCGLHSLLITRRARDYFVRRLGERFVWFRLAYNIFSLVTLIPVVLVHWRLQGPVLFAWSGYWQVARLVLFGAAGLLFYGGARAYDMGYFLGLKQVREYRAGRRPAPARLSREGVLGYVRHPWYTAGLLVIWTLGPVTAASLVAKVVLSGYLVIGAVLEERKLVAEFGEEYRQYQREVNMLLPWPRRK